MLATKLDGPTIALDLLTMRVGVTVQDVLATCSPKRQEIFSVLQERDWFKNTAAEVQIELARLPESFDGFLKDLSERPDRISNVTPIRMLSTGQRNFCIAPIFDVRFDDGKSGTYEYVSWKYGPESGVKGIVLIERNGTPTHFILLKGEKFSTGKMETSCLGGFMTPDPQGAVNHFDSIIKELREELGSPDIELVRNPDILGQVNVDTGLTNNSPILFLAHIDASAVNAIPDDPENADSFELRAKTSIYPISQLWKVVAEDRDGLFLSTVAKAFARGLLPAPVSTDSKNNSPMD